MEFFDRIVIPPNANHILLLKYILVISMLLFVPYLGMMLGASTLSVYLNRKASKTGNNMFVRFAKDIIEKLTISRNAGYALGAIPVLSLVFIYAQLLFEAKTIILSILLFSAVLFLIAFGLIYRYRSGFETAQVINSLKGLVKEGANEVVEGFSEYEEKLVSSNSRSGLWGSVTLYLAAYLFAGSTSLTVNPDKWGGVNNILQVMFSWQSIFSFLYLIAISGAITGTAILFYFFKWQGGLKNNDREYSNFASRFASNLAFVSALCLPLLLFIDFMYLPLNALSGDVFVYIGCSIIALLVLCNFLYLMYKSTDTKFASAVFFLILIVLAFNILVDQAVLGNATKEHLFAVTLKAEEIEKQTKSKVVSVSGINGEDIYNTKCVACHKFETKVVGPAYKETVPKYSGNVQKLADYIYNPVKIDPAFPPMPNQGLKKKEAVAVAQYLLDKVAGKK